MGKSFAGHRLPSKRLNQVSTPWLLGFVGQHLPRYLLPYLPRGIAVESCLATALEMPFNACRLM